MHPFADKAAAMAQGASAGGITGNTIRGASRLDNVLELAEKLRAQAGNLAERTQTVANRVIGMPPPAATGSAGAEAEAESSLGRIQQTLTHAGQLLEALHGHLQRLEAL